ncbi:MAG: hypothetical protein BMS9Abin31_1217 [Gammaproteobacteria bacterium]|nr:MAG: hypothetical protein BMS9Abin31_1217 [Gammaproteobacteria bacterium]
MVFGLVFSPKNQVLLMHKIITLGLITLLFTGCSAYKKTAALPDSTYLADSAKLKSISLELTTHLGDQQQFVEGDEIQFLLSLGQDAYIYMYYIDAANNITQILPNVKQQNNFYKAGYFLTIPEYENLYRFTINEPFGKEAIWVIASDSSIKMKQTPGSIKNIKQFIKKSSEKAYGEYVLNIVTARQGKNGH